MGKARRFRSSGSPSASSPAESNVQKGSNRGQQKRALKRASLVKKIRGHAHRQEEPENDEDEKGQTSANVLPKSAKVEAVAASTVARGMQGTFQRVVSNKGKKSLMAAEMGQLSTVLDAPSFQQDPFAAIQEHLRQTAAPISPSVQRQKPQRNTKATRPKDAPKAGRQSWKAGGDKKHASKPYKGRHAKMKMKR